MRLPRLDRAAAHARAAAPAGLVHLGLGNFFRAHQCWYTEHARDAADWGFAAFSGRRSGPLLDELAAQEGLYTLLTRGPDHDDAELITAVSGVHAAADHEEWLRRWEAPELAVATITVTEAGWRAGADGGLDAAQPEVRADVGALRADARALVRTAPARLLAGLAARRRAGGGPVAIVPCDNTPGNGALAERVVRDLAGLVDPALPEAVGETAEMVTTMVDRITPRAGPEDERAAAGLTGFADRCPVVTEPFREWVLSGAFPAGRPRWEDAGATFTDDVVPFEHRKLWLLNGAHSLLAYAGSLRGHETVAQAIHDDACRAGVEEWWDTAAPHLHQPDADVAAYRTALLDRFANERIMHRLEQIAADGSQKLPIRILPVLRAERGAGAVPLAATRVLAAWVCHLRGLGAPVDDARADDVVPLARGELETAVPRVLGWLDAALAEDREVVAAVVEQSAELAATETR